MRMVSRAVAGLSFVSIVWAAGLHAQGWTPLAGVSNASIKAILEADKSLAGMVLKEIDDSCTGDRWLLLRDASQPGGPGRLVRVSRNGLAVQTDGLESTAANVPPKAAPVIHAGDALVLEESTPLIEVRLEARALGPAACGAEFKARLAIGGKIVRAIALGKGRAAFVTEADRKP